MATIEDFEKIDIRIGKVLKAEDYPEGRKPYYKLTIDFGDEIGKKLSLAQLTAHYQKEELIGKLVMGVTNFPPRRIGSVESEVLTLGVPDENGEPVLLEPTEDIPLGGKLF